MWDLDVVYVTDVVCEGDTLAVTVTEGVNVVDCVRLCVDAAVDEAVKEGVAENEGVNDDVKVSDGVSLGVSLGVSVADDVSELVLECVGDNVRVCVADAERVCVAVVVGVGVGVGESNSAQDSSPDAELPKSPMLAPSYLESKVHTPGMANVVQKMVVNVAFRTWHSGPVGAPVDADTSRTTFRSALGKKPVPVICTTVPPQKLPVLGEMDATDIWYVSIGTPGFTRARPRPPSCTTTTTGYSPADASCTRQVMLVVVAAVTLQNEYAPISTMLPSSVAEKPVPVMTKVSPAVMVLCDTPDTTGVSAATYE